MLYICVLGEREGGTFRLIEAAEGRDITRKRYPLHVLDIALSIASSKPHLYTLCIFVVVIFIMLIHLGQGNTSGVQSS